MPYCAAVGPVAPSVFDGPREGGWLAQSASFAFQGRNLSPTARITCRDCGSPWTYRQAKGWPESLWLCRACDQIHEEDSWLYWQERGFQLNVIKASRVEYDVRSGAIWRPSTRRLAASLRARINWVLSKRSQPEAFDIVTAARLVGDTPREVMRAIMRVEAEFGRRKRGWARVWPDTATKNREAKRRERARRRGVNGNTPLVVEGHKGN